MRTKRMFSRDITHSEAFLEMPEGSKVLYFYLNLEADDEGFVEPKRIMRMLGTVEDSFKVLLLKKFIVLFESGVVVIRHWRQHNNMDKYNFTPTLFQVEISQLLIDVNKNYEFTVCQSGGRLESDLVQSASKVKISKDKINKDNIASTNVSAPSAKKKVVFTELGAKVIKAFESVDAKNKLYYSNKTQRSAADYLIAEYGLEKVLEIINILPQTNKMLYVPRIHSPWDLQEKWVSLVDAMKSKTIEKQSKKRIMV